VEEYKNIYQIFYKKFEWMRKHPWKEVETPFIEIDTTGFSGWGFERR